MTTIDILKRLCDAFFLTVSPYDQYNDWPIDFMSALEATLYDAEVDREKYDGAILRALNLFKPYIEFLKEGKDT